jgi:hypothetical protein
MAIILIENSDHLYGHKKFTMRSIRLLFYAILVILEAKKSCRRPKNALKFWEYIFRYFFLKFDVKKLYIQVCVHHI